MIPFVLTHEIVDVDDPSLYTVYNWVELCQELLMSLATFGDPEQMFAGAKNTRKKIIKSSDRNSHKENRGGGKITGRNNFSFRYHIK